MIRTIALGDGQLCRLDAKFAVAVKALIYIFLAVNLINKLRGSICPISIRIRLGICRIKADVGQLCIKRQTHAFFSQFRRRPFYLLAINLNLRHIAQSVIFNRRSCSLLKRGLMRTINAFIDGEFISQDIRQICADAENLTLYLIEESDKFFVGDTVSKLLTVRRYCCPQ